MQNLHITNSFLIWAPSEMKEKIVEACMITYEHYDAADTSTIYQRSTAICKMHKARVRANNYYWNKLGRKLEKENKKVSSESTYRAPQSNFAQNC